MRLLVAALLLLAFALPSAAAASFGDPPAKVGSGPVAGVAAASGGSGRAAVAWLSGDHRTVHVAVRERPGAPWVETELARWQNPNAVRVVRNARGTVVVAWTGYDDGKARLGLAVLTPGGAPIRRILALPRNFTALVRLAVDARGHVLIAMRDAYRRLSIGRVTSAARIDDQTAVARNVSAFALATGSTNALAWTVGATPHKVLRAIALSPGGHPAGAAQTVSHDATGEIQMAIGDRPLVSWVRPLRPGRPAQIFTRSLQPAMRPARAFSVPDSIPYGPAHLAMDEDRALAAAQVSFGSPFGIGIIAGRSRFGGVWSGVGPVGERTVMVSQPQPFYLAGHELIVYARIRPVEPGELIEYEVVVSVDRSGPVAIGEGLSTPGGRGIAVDELDGTALVAWPGPDGVLVTEHTSAAS